MRTLFRISIRNIITNPVRFGLTVLSVLVGVSFVVASFVLTDGLRSTFNAIIDDASAEVDAQVRARSDFTEVEFVSQPIDQDLLEAVEGVDGVAQAVATGTSQKITPVAPDGEPLKTLGPPILSFNWDDSELSPLNLVAGEGPDGPGEFALDETTVDREGFVLGDTYDMIGIEGAEPFELVGITRFGEQNALAGAVLMVFTLDELQRLDGSEGEIVSIEVSAERGVDPAQLVADLEAALPDTVEAVGSEVVVDEGKEAFQSVVDIFGNILLAFALVSVFVSAFIINNTFNIVLGQRVRQLALLRAIGGTVRQVRTGALMEALAVALVASGLGLLGGVVLAVVLRAIMNSAGFNLPDLDIIVTARTIIAALVVGVGVTLVASLSPARKAASVPPMAAISEGYRFGSGEGTRRTIIGLVLAVVGAALMVWALFGDPGNTALLLVALGAGAVAVFVALAMLMPLFSSPVARLIAKPLEWLPGLGVLGRLVRENSGRDNKRTAATAAGLMIGLALVAMASVVATSLKDSFRASLSSNLTADYLVTTAQGGSFSPNVVEQVQATSSFGDVSSVRFGTMRIDGSEKAVSATDLTLLTSLLDVGVLSGDPVASAEPDQILIKDDVATDRDLEVGDRLEVEFAATGSQTMTVGAIYDNDFLVGNYILDLSGWDENFDFDEDFVIAAQLAEGATIADAEEALAPVEEAFPQLEIETRKEFSDRQESQLDSLLVVINVFLGLAIVVALLGITNTFALSVLERTREIGLMRAVGMTRRQTRRMIRWEAAVVSLFGAALGIGVGIIFGWAAVAAIPESIIDGISIPVPTLVVYVIIATIAGLLAASFPARRAARLDILRAIAHE